MAGAARYTYRGAALLAVVWLVVSVLLALLATWLNRNFDTARQWTDALRWTVILALALLPFVAGAVHRSLRVVTLTALLEALSLGVLMVVLLN